MANPQDPDLVPTQFKNRVVLRNIDHSNNAAMNWCRENVVSRHQYEIISFLLKPTNNSTTIYSFAKKEDAMAFKLIFV